MFLCCYVTSYTIVLQKIDTCSCKKERKLDRQLGKTAVVKAYTVSIDRKTTVYKHQTCEIVFF